MRQLRLPQPVAIVEAPTTGFDRFFLLVTFTQPLPSFESSQ
jgi:hypothetical protein